MKETFFKGLFYTGLPALLRYNKSHQKQATILCMHRIGDESSVAMPPLTIKNFKRLLEYVCRHYEVCTIEGLQAYKGIKPPLVFSFDDGFLDFYENGLPLLRQYGVPCNVNVITSCLDFNYQIWTQKLVNFYDELVKRKYKFSAVINEQSVCVNQFDNKFILKECLKIFFHLFSREEKYVSGFINQVQSKLPFSIPETPMMNWENLKTALAGHDIELGSHTKNHHILSNIKEEIFLAEEIVGSKTIIETNVGKKVSVIAYPNGDYNAQALELSAEAGYRHFLAVGNKLVSLSQADTPLLTRMYIGYPGYYQNIFKAENFHEIIKKILPG